MNASQTIKQAFYNKVLRTLQGTCQKKNYKQMEFAS